MNTKHTPGPAWVVELASHREHKGTNTGVVHVCANDDSRTTSIAVVYGPDELKHAALIAAAPELLETLTELVAQHEEKCYPKPERQAAAYAAAVKAIAKAEGRS